MSLPQRVLGRIVDVRREETVTMLLMFAYSFLAMAGYNIVKPATRSQFIDQLGADNLPYVQLVSGIIMGFVIQGYTNAMRLLPRRWVFAATQAVMVGLLVVFWVLFQTGQQWVSVAFYLCGRPGRQPAHQPVLVARQRHLRRAAGQAPLRVRRRRRQPRRHRRVRLRGQLRAVDRHEQPAARRRRHARRVLRRRVDDRHAREVDRPVRRSAATTTRA